MRVTFGSIVLNEEQYMLAHACLAECHYQRGMFPMIPTEFLHVNVVIAKDQKQYLPLPAYVDDRCTTTCWRLSWYERLKLLCTGRLWLQQLNFGGALQPQRPAVHSPFRKTNGVDYTRRPSGARGDYKIEE